MLFVLMREDTWSDGYESSSSTNLIGVFTSQESADAYMKLNPLHDEDRGDHNYYSYEYIMYVTVQNVPNSTEFIDYYK